MDHYLNIITIMTIKFFFTHYIKKDIYIYIYIYIYIFVDPAFFTIMRFPLKKARLVFYFEKSFLENGLKSPLIFVLF